MARAREFRHGQRVKIGGRVGDDVTGDLRGIEGTVEGGNPTYVAKDSRGRDVPCVAVKTEDGRLVSLPQSAVRTR